MPDNSMPEVRLLAPAQVGELLSLSVDEVMALVMSGQIRGMQVGTPPRWRIDEASVGGYLDDQAEEARRMALWRQSNAASFPELWGGGIIRQSE
ncbi:DNA-binding protein [Microbacterium sp. NPDC076911]|uniref:DNA-binding protein n=1 Tax=Microbacterium sp. NPDC076911 TaxID=3154958 RepID=UPI0034164E76